MTNYTPTQEQIEEWERSVAPVIIGLNWGQVPVLLKLIRGESISSAERRELIPIEEILEQGE